MGEANLSAEEPQAFAEARLSPSDVHARRKSRDQGSTAQGPTPPLGLIGPSVDRATFVALRRSGRRVRRGPITVTFLAGDPAEEVRVAYAVGRRVGGAVQRNQLRRRLRAAVAELGQQLRPGAYLMGAGPEARSLSYEELKASLKEALASLDRGTDR